VRRATSPSPLLLTVYNTLMKKLFSISQLGRRIITSHALVGVILLDMLSALANVPGNDKRRWSEVPRDIFMAARRMGEYTYCSCASPLLGSEHILSASLLFHVHVEGEVVTMYGCNSQNRSFVLRWGDIGGFAVRECPMYSKPEDDVLKSSKREERLKIVEAGELFKQVVRLRTAAGACTTFTSQNLTTHDSHKTC
jgi:hypothetical protein